MGAIGAWLRDLVDYLVALAHHLRAFLMGSLVSAALMLLLGTSPDLRVPPSTFVIVFVVFGVLAASFEAWREQREKSRRAETEARALQDAVAQKATVKATREHLADLFQEGEGLRALLFADPSIRTTEKKVFAWVSKVENYLKQSPPPLDRSHLIRFQNPPPPAHIASNSFGEEIRFYTEVLRTMIVELQT